MDYITPRQTSGGEQVLKLFADPFQSQIQIRAFWASFGLSLGVSAALTLLFSLLRPRHNLVYAPRLKYADSKHTLPPMGKGPFSWIKPVAKVKEEVLLERIGVDAVIFLRFTRMLRNIFCILAVIGLVIMIPVNVTQGDKSVQGKSNVFAIMTPLYTFGNGLWAQVIVAYFINIVVMLFLWLNYRKIHGMRRSYFESEDYQQSLHARSVLIRHIPPELRSQEGILRLTDQVNPSGAIPIPTTAPNVKELPDLIEMHEDAVRKLESVLAKYLKNPDRLPARKPTMKAPKNYKGPTSDGKVDAIDYWRGRIAGLERHIMELRNASDSHDVMSYGFASWDQVSQAHTVALAAQKKSPKGTKIRLAPRPSEIIWKNLTLTKSQLRRRSIMNFVWTTVLTIVWTPLNAGLAVFVANLSNLGSVWPSFQGELIRHRTFWAIVQGIAAPAITSGIYLVLPIIFRRLQIRAGDVTKTARDRHVLRNLYLFFVLNNLIVFSLFAAIWQWITNIINASGKTDVWTAIQNSQFFNIVTAQLCQSISPFWVIWILQRNLGAAIDLAQLWTLFYQWFAKTFMAPTPRQHIEWTAPQSFLYPSYYNYFLFYATVSLCFATMQPIILVCTALYFTMDSVLKKYLLMYVFVTKTESGGQFWRTIYNRMLFACVLADVVVGVTVRGRQGTWGMVIALVPLILLVLGFKWYCFKSFDHEMHFYQKAGLQDSERPAEMTSKSVGRATLKFQHPAIDSKLMTPMVSAKAKHIVQQIYSGRLGSDIDAGPGAFSDIPMQNINKRPEPTNHAPFEVVSEAQQDFSFYRNRADFRGVAGDTLGKPEDLINSRPGTPGSFITGAFRSTTPYTDVDKYVDQLHKPVYEAQGKQLETRRSQIHPALRSNTPSYNQLAQVETTDPADMGMQPSHGPYTDPNDDRVNLLGGAGDVRTPNGEFMSMDQWRTGNSTPHNGGDDRGGYDYFRGHSNR